MRYLRHVFVHLTSPPPDLFHHQICGREPQPRPVRKNFFLSPRWSFPYPLRSDFSLNQVQKFTEKSLGHALFPLRYFFHWEKPGSPHIHRDKIPIIPLKSPPLWHHKYIALIMVVRKRPDAEVLTDGKPPQRSPFDTHIGKIIFFCHRKPQRKGCQRIS
jgi:hypothetical protein